MAEWKRLRRTGSVASNMRDSNLCTSCRYIDTVQHYLLECRQHSTIRNNLTSEIQVINVSFSLNNLLGKDSVPARSRKKFLGLWQNVYTSQEEQMAYRKINFDIPTRPCSILGLLSPSPSVITCFVNLYIDVSITCEVTWGWMLLPSDISCSVR